MSDWPLMILLVVMVAAVFAAFLLGLHAGYRLSFRANPVPSPKEMVAAITPAPKPAPPPPDPDEIERLEMVRVFDGFASANGKRHGPEED